jgi:hypothetical protein
MIAIPTRFVFHIPPNTPPPRKVWGLEIVSPDHTMRRVFVDGVRWDSRPATKKIRKMIRAMQ